MLDLFNWSWSDGKNSSSFFLKLSFDVAVNNSGGNLFQLQTNRLQMKILIK